MRVHVAFTPDEQAAAPTGVVVDTIRATSTIAQALAAGYERVLCAAEVEEARALAGDGVVLGGERLGVRIEGFELGNSPQEYLEPRGHTLAMSTTNGTRAVLVAAERCERVLIAALVNVGAVVEACRAHGEDVAIFCAGVKGQPCIDDTYVAGRIAERLGCERSDSAEIAVRLVHSFGNAEEAFRLSRSGRNLINHGPELEADIPWVAREDLLDVVPRFVAMAGVAAEIRL